MTTYVGSCSHHKQTAPVLIGTCLRPTSVKGLNEIVLVRTCLRLLCSEMLKQTGPRGKNEPEFNSSRLNKAGVKTPSVSISLLSTNNFTRFCVWKFLSSNYHLSQRTFKPLFPASSPLHHHPTITSVKAPSRLQGIWELVAIFRAQSLQSLINRLNTEVSTK